MSKIKQFVGHFKFELKRLSEIETKPKSVRNCLLIAIAVTALFLLPFLFILVNLFFLGNYTLIKLNITIIVFILCLVPRCVYYDALKHYNEEIKEINFKAGHVVWMFSALIASVVIMCVL